MCIDSKLFYSSDALNICLLPGAASNSEISNKMALIYTDGLGGKTAVRGHQG